MQYRKKTAFFLILCILLGSALQAQFKFEDLSLQDAIKKAALDDRMVLVYVSSGTCSQCNEVAANGFSAPEIARLIKDHAIPIKVIPGTADYIYLDSLYSTGGHFGSVFIDKNSNFLHKYMSTSTLAATNAEQFAKALSKKEHPDLEMVELQKDYDKGERDFNKMYALVAKKNAADINHDELTEEMLNLAPVDSAESPSFIRFIIEQAAMVGSPVQVYARRNGPLFSAIWNQMPSDKRIRINQKLIARSMEKAVQLKNVQYAEKVAVYSAGTYSTQVERSRSHDRQMMDFYKKTNDTTHYLTAAAAFYDRYLMTASVDSIHRVDSLQLLAMRVNALPDTVSTLYKPGTLMKTSFIYSPVSQRPAAELNDGAFAVYTMTHDAFYNARALQWSERSLLFYSNGSSLDTYARLLYRAGKEKEAIINEEKAISLIRTTRMQATEFEGILAKMKAGERRIDQY